MNKDKTALLANNDENLRSGMRAILEDQNFIVKEVATGFEAEQVLAMYSFDLIISDLNQSEYDGVKLLGHVRRKGYDRFLLITEMRTPLQSRHAKKLGANAHLTKPFARHDFIQAVDLALVSEVEVPTVSQGQDYSPISMNEFSETAELPADVYLNLAQKKFVRIANKGDTLDPHRLSTYQNKGRQWLYMKRTDFADYIGFQVAKKEVHYSEDQKSEYARHLANIKHSVETVTSQMCQAGMTIEQLEYASHMILSTVDLLAADPSTIALLGCGDQRSKAYHPVATAIWSCLIARNLGWRGSALYFKIIISALFHDIGSRDLSSEIMAKKKADLSREEISILENHVIRGRDILSKISVLPKEAAIVAYQHHELMNGGGFPQNLKRDQIHPMTRLISVADSINDVITRISHGNELNLSFAFGVLTKSDFDPVYLSALQVLIEGAEKNAEQLWPETNVKAAV